MHTAPCRSAHWAVLWLTPASYRGRSQPCHRHVLPCRCVHARAVSYRLGLQYRSPPPPPPPVGDTKLYHDTTPIGRVVSHVHSVVSHAPSIVSHVHSVVSHAPSVVSHAPSVVSHAHSVVSHAHSVVSHARLPCRCPPATIQNLYRDTPR